MSKTHAYNKSKPDPLNIAGVDLKFDHDRGVISVSSDVNGQSTDIAIDELKSIELYSTHSWVKEYANKNVVLVCSGNSIHLIAKFSGFRSWSTFHDQSAIGEDKFWEAVEFVRNRLRANQKMPNISIGRPPGWWYRVDIVVIAAFIVFLLQQLVAGEGWAKFAVIILVPSLYKYWCIIKKRFDKIDPSDFLSCTKERLTEVV